MKEEKENVQKIKKGAQDFSSWIQSRKRKCLPKDVKSPSQVSGRFYSSDPFELFNLLEDLRRMDSLSDETVVIGINRAKEVLFREIRNQNPSGEIYYYGDDIPMRNKLTSNFNIFSRIMELLTSKGNSFRTIHLCFSDSDLISLFELLKSEDELERTNIAKTVRNLQVVHKSKIMELLENEFQMFSQGLRTHIGVDDLLGILPSEGMSPDFYFQVVLGFMRTRHLDLFGNYKGKVVEICKKNFSLADLTLKFIFHIFDEVQGLGKIILVEIMIELLTHHKKEVKFSQFVKGLSCLINSSLTSSHHLLLEEVVGIFEVREIYDLIQEHVQDFLPLIFPTLYSLSKKYWRKKGKVRLFKNISLILSMDHKTFESCLINYNRQRYYDAEKDEESLGDVVEKCLEYSELEKKNEEKFNKRRANER